MKLHIIVKLLLGIVLGIVLGFVCPMPFIQTLSSVGYVLGQYIKFIIPLLVVAFLAKGIADFGKQAGRALLIGLILAYTSTILAELLGFAVASFALPKMKIEAGAVEAGIKIVPYLKIDIPPIFPMMSALVFSIILGLGITRSNSPTLSKGLIEFNAIIKDIIKYAVIPVFPYWIATIFMEITAKGQLIPTAKAFLGILLLVIPTQWVWLLVLYIVAGIYTKQNPWLVLKTMLPAYLTAMGTMSSSATLPIELECAHQVPFLKKKTVDFCIPLFNIAHLSGAAMAITMSAVTVSLLAKGSMLTLGQIMPFILMLGFIEVAAVGVPGGSVTAALGILESMLLFDTTGLGLMTALFMIQDSFGTAANVTGDGALTMIVDKLMESDEEPGESATS